MPCTLLEAESDIELVVATLGAAFALAQAHREGVDVFGLMPDSALVELLGPALGAAERVKTLLTDESPPSNQIS